MKAIRRNPDKTKELILEKAEAAFALKGFDGARVAGIAEEAGVNKGMIYHYFKNKDNLYREVLKRNFMKLEVLARDILTGKNGVLERVTEAIRQYFYFLAGHPEFVRLMSWEALQDNKYTAQVVRPFFESGIAPLENLVREGIEEGVLRKDLDVRQWIFSVNALCFYYFTRRSFLADLWKKDIAAPDMLEERLRHILSLLLEGSLEPGAAGGQEEK